MIYRNASGSLVDVSANMADMNDHDNTNALIVSSESSMAANRHLTFVFPELRNIDGYFIHAIQANGSFVIEAVETSVDTVDGSGGTWTQAAATWTDASSLSPTWRNSITPLSASGIKGLRFRYTWTTTSSGRQIEWRAIHLYGSVVAGQNPNRLRAWHPTLDQEVGAAYFDFADIAQGTQLTKQFRLRNDSATLTANNITLSQDSVNGGGMGLTFSSDGTNFSSSILISTIAPNSNSSVLYVRRSVGAAEAIQLRASLIKAIASSWT
jgi:hypothetical protein